MKTGTCPSSAAWARAAATREAQSAKAAAEPSAGEYKQITCTGEPPPRYEVTRQIRDSSRSATQTGDRRQAMPRTAAPTKPEPACHSGTVEEAAKAAETRWRAGREHLGSCAARSKGPRHTAESKGRCSAVATLAETSVSASCRGPACEARPNSAKRSPEERRLVHHRAANGLSRKPPRPAKRRGGAAPSTDGPGPDPTLAGRSDRETDRDPPPLRGPPARARQKGRGRRQERRPGTAKGECQASPRAKQSRRGAPKQGESKTPWNASTSSRAAAAAAPRKAGAGQEPSPQARAKKSACRTTNMHKQLEECR